jgi:CheY-like chemotaxis protein
MAMKKILVVDDEPDVVMFLTTALEDAGYEAVSASNAVDGLQMIRKERPDLVCLDILMPEESGIALFRKLRNDPHLGSIPVVIHSGLSPRDDLAQIHILEQQDGTTLRAPEGFIEKPAEAEHFLRLVKKVLC